MTAAELDPTFCPAAVLRGGLRTRWRIRAEDGVPARFIRQCRHRVPPLVARPLGEALCWSHTNVFLARGRLLLADGRRVRAVLALDGTWSLAVLPARASFASRWSAPLAVLLAHFPRRVLSQLAHTCTRARGNPSRYSERHTE